MCFEIDSAPPIPAIEGGALEHRDLELESADGTRFAAFAAVPEEPSGAGIVILPDVRGLYRFYEELALRFAERGVAAAAIDYFGRTAGVGKRGDDFPYMEHVAQTTPEGIQADVRSAVQYLRSPEGGSCRAVFTSASASGAVSPGSPRRAGTVSPVRSASTGGRAFATGRPAPRNARTRSRRPSSPCRPGTIRTSRRRTTRSSTRR